MQPSTTQAHPELQAVDHDPWPSVRRYPRTMREAFGNANDAFADDKQAAQKRTFASLAWFVLGFAIGYAAISSF